MAGRIPQGFIDDLLDRTDLVELIGRHVTLKRSGAEFKACCPFHNENTPSFYVSPKKQFYHCFGCGVHGTAVTFLMEYANLEFPEAIEELADIAGLEVPREDTAPGDATPPANSPLRDVLEAAARFYQRQLRHCPEAIDYLKRRGLSGETAARFGVGWAPPGHDALLSALAPSHAIEHLIQAGLTTEDGRRDRFFGRVMFPIRDRRGRVVGFGGRLIRSGEPKYLNSSEGPLFHKGEVVYGLYEARQAGAGLNELVVTEGYMDVIGLAEAGFRRAVACMGTALTTMQLELLWRQVERIVLCFDGDAAGLRAARRSIETALPIIGGTRSLRVLLLDNGDDPDELVRREGLASWEQRLAGARPLADTLLDLLARDYPLDAADTRSQFAHAALDAIAPTGDDIWRAQLVRALADRSQTPLATLEPLLDERRHALERARANRGNRRDGVSPGSAAGGTSAASGSASSRAASATLRASQARGGAAGGTVPPRSDIPGFDDSQFDAAQFDGRRAASGGLEASAAASQADRTGTAPLWRQLFARLLQEPTLAQRVPSIRALAELEHVEPHAGRLLVDVLALLERHPGLAMHQILERLRDHPGHASISALPAVHIETDATMLERVSADLVDQIGRRLTRRRIRQLTTGAPLGEDARRELQRLAESLRS